MRKFREQDYYLVITDLQMPTMGGDENGFRNRAEAPGAPGDLDDRLSGFDTRKRTDYYAVIAKPFRGGEMTALVERALASAKA